jgi:ubiquinone/menaquinone biosynthesis C-methylase UbiE
MGKSRKSDAVNYEGLTLPPASLRFCGDEFKDDAYFVKSARLEVKRLIEHAGLSVGSRVLDIGCGPGRLAIGIIAELGSVASYIGVDVNEPALEWCQRHIAPAHPNFRFVRFDDENERYNPKGKAKNTPLPAADASVDVINLYSVFSHLTYGNVVKTLKEMRRVIKPRGRVFLTAFVEENVPNYAINPPNYQEHWVGALHCVRFDREFFESMLNEAGFLVTEFVHGRETNGQSAFYLSPSDV